MMFSGKASQHFTPRYQTPYLIKEAGSRNISYSFLSESYFAGMRPQLSYHKLQELAQFAEELEMPRVFGKFNDEKHYLDTLHFVLHSTEETRHRGFFYLRNIMQNIIDGHRLLEIGPGNGELLCWIGNRFRSITVIDNNYEVIKNLNISKKLLKSFVQLERQHSCILDAFLPENHFELINLSHVLYYVDRSSWLGIVEKLYNSLKIDGQLIIVLSGDRNGKAALMKHFGGEPLNTDDLVSQIIQKFNAKIDVFESYEFFRSLSLRGILHIAGFFLADAHITANKEPLLEYVSKHFRKLDGRFYLSSQQKYIIVQKLA